MFNVNGPPRGFNVLQDQSSYDLVFKDIIIDSALGSVNGKKDGRNRVVTSGPNM